MNVLMMSAKNVTRQKKNAKSATMLKKSATCGKHEIHVMNARRFHCCEICESYAIYVSYVIGDQQRRFEYIIFP
jgi:hypothetical protein